MAELSYTLKINPELKDVLNNQAMQAGLEAVGQVLEGQIVTNIKTMKIVDTGRLKNSITYKTKTKQKGEGLDSSPADNEVLIGTNVKYAPYIEYGTPLHPVLVLDDPSKAKTEASRNLSLWAKRKGLKIRGWIMLGGPPKSFVRSALDQWRSKINDVFAASYKKVLDSKK